MKSDSVDILLVTHDRPQHTRMMLPRLLETCDERMHVWIWHNGDDEETLESVAGWLGHSAVREFHHSRERVGVREALHWVWTQAEGALIARVGDDCLLPSDWAQRLRRAHHDEPTLGVLGCWPYAEEDTLPEVASRKIESFGGGHQVLLNSWVEAGASVMKRNCIFGLGPLRSRDDFHSYCLRLDRQGWVNGWLYPFVQEECLDDPRNRHALLESEADFRSYRPQFAVEQGVDTLAAWQVLLRESARRLQELPPGPKSYAGWTRWRKGLIKKALRQR